MKTVKPMDPTSASLSTEAGEWLLNLEDGDADADHPYPDPAQRQEAFLKWATRSPQHTRAFLEMAEIWRRLTRIDSQRHIQIQKLLEDRAAEVIHLYEPQHAQVSRQFRSPTSNTLPSPIRRRMWSTAAGLAIALVVAALITRNTFGPQSHATAVGEQHAWKLEDGSIVYLNTDSRVRIDFSDRLRHVELLEGEAFFVVEREAVRPFVVKASNVVIQAVGTQFNVRQRAHTTDVAVIEGVVQVAATSVLQNQRSSMPLRLAAGEEALVADGTVNKRVIPDVADALSWRERRLVFRNASLADIAAEFNRYNRSQIRVEGMQARTRQLTGVFDADRPESLIFYTSKDETLTVRPVGEDWVIRAR